MKVLQLSIEKRNVCASISEAKQMVKQRDRTLRF